MDSTILQLFTVEEILERLAHKKLTGCFHAFSPKESANIYFKDGIIVAASNERTEGEEALKQLLDWKDARYLWQANITVPSPLKPLEINIRDFLAKQKPGAKVSGKASPTILGPKNPATAPSPSVIPIGSKGKSTGPLPESAGVKAVTSVDLTATKTFNPTAEARASQDEALLARYKMALAPVDPAFQRLKLTQVSNLIGRNPACDITISHPSISRQHCLLQITERGLHVKDLDTTNGTKVNGIVLKEGYISVGDKLTIGHLHFKLEKD